MPCKECPHCRAIAERAALRLTQPPGHRGSQPNLLFYRRFATVYDLAAQRSGQPQKLLRDVNPWLTASRCSDYLKRAREYGYVRTPGRKDKATAQAGTGQTVDAMMARTSLQPAWESGVPISLAMLAASQTTRKFGTPEQVLAQLAAVGEQLPDGSVRRPAQVAG